MWGLTQYTELSQMARIEVWKSKTDLRTKPFEEQEKIFDRAARLIKTMAGDAAADNEPFLVEQKWGNLLVWTARDNTEKFNLAARKHLGEYYEPLTFVARTDARTAEVLARKLRARE
jgi:hypothetical protein